MELFGRYAVAWGLIALAAGGWLPSNTFLLAQDAPVAAIQSADALKIVVIQGEDAVNIIRKKTAVPPIVEVRDRNNLPVAGASVTFTVPATGPGGTFLNGARSLTIVANSSGRAAVESLHPVGPGAFKIGVSAEFEGNIATAAISQTNFLTVAAASSAGFGGAVGVAGAGATGVATGAGLSIAAIAGIVGGVAAVAGVVVVVKTLGGNKPTSTATTPTTVGIGGSSVGPP